jgi:hypothetical protein
LLRDGVLTGRQIRNAAAVCNRGLVFQTDAWHCLGLQVAMLKKVRTGGTGSCWPPHFPSSCRT